MFGLNKAELGLECKPVRDHFQSNAPFLRRKKVMKMKAARYAAPYAPFFSGPVRKRSCTDLICCILFLAVIAGYMVMGVLAWLFGDPRHVLFPRNSTGMFCGAGMNRDQPRMIYVDILKCAMTTNVMAEALGGVCVRKCPSQFWMLSAAAYDPVAKPKDFFHQQYCDHSLNLTTTTWTVQQILDAELCPPFLVPTLGRGLPSLHALNSAPSNFTLPGMASVNETVNSIRSAMGVVGYLMSTLLYPLFTFVLLLVCVAYWGMTTLVVSLSDPSVAMCSLINGSEICKPQTFNSSAYPYCPSVRCIFFKYDDAGLFQQNLVYLQVYNVFAFLWCVNFVIALGQCTLAGTFASYYWAFSKPAEISPFALSQCFIRTLQYHSGWCWDLDHKTRGSQSACGRFLLNCLRCYFWCLEYFLKVLNRNAYIMIAIYWESFCVSAKNAYSLLMRNIGRVVLLDRVTDMLLFFGKLLVVASVGGLAFFFFSGRIRLPGNTFQAEILNYYWVPIVVLMAGAYLIAQGFFSVYSMCIDALFLCFLEDLERNDGTMQKPYYVQEPDEDPPQTQTVCYSPAGVWQRGLAFSRHELEITQQGGGEREKEREMEGGRERERHLTMCLISDLRRLCSRKATVQLSQAAVVSVPPIRRSTVAMWTQRGGRVGRGGESIISPRRRHDPVTESHTSAREDAESLGVRWLSGGVSDAGLLLQSGYDNLSGNTIKRVRKGPVAEQEKDSFGGNERLRRGRKGKVEIGVKAEKVTLCLGSQCVHLGRQQQVQVEDGDSPLALAGNRWNQAGGGCATSFLLLYLQHDSIDKHQ
ncbi:unnamed protein product, partial [Coregonus sp. 'balchen']